MDTKEILCRFGGYNEVEYNAYMTSCPDGAKEFAEKIRQSILDDKHISDEFKQRISGT